jgi:ribosome biogenesis GTPase
VGDLVMVQYDDSSFTRDGEGATPSEDGTGIMIAEILPRKNDLIRPPLANVDVMLVVVAAASPDPDIPTLDKLLTILEFNRIEPVLVIGKAELKPKRAAKIAALYEQIGYRTFVLSCYTGEGVQAFSDFAHTALQGRITAVAGASGAGKSTLLNTVFPGLNLVTGDISEKIGRGKNTTRHTELFDLPGQSGYIADTAGFSLLDFERFDFFTLEDLPHTLREFTPYLGKCRYTDCMHLSDEGCAILEAVQAGVIPRTRHEAYKELYATLKEKKKYK